MCFADPLSQTYCCTCVELGWERKLIVKLGEWGKTLNLSNPILGHFRVAVCVSYEASLGSKLL